MRPHVTPPASCPANRVPAQIRTIAPDEEPHSVERRPERCGEDDTTGVDRFATQEVDGRDEGDERRNRAPEEHHGGQRAAVDPEFVRVEIFGVVADAGDDDDAEGEDDEVPDQQGDVGECGEAIAEDGRRLGLDAGHFEYVGLPCLSGG